MVVREDDIRLGKKNYSYSEFIIGFVQREKNFFLFFPVLCLKLVNHSLKISLTRPNSLVVLTSKMAG